jgi:hypothetical protein
MIENGRSSSVVNVRSLAVVLVFVLGLGLAFYGGRVYQDNVDQPLFTQYTPAVASGARASGATGSGTGGSFFGGGGTGGSQTGAALAYATPPATAGTGTSSTQPAGGTGTGSGAGTGSSGSAPGTGTGSGAGTGSAGKGAGTGSAGNGAGTRGGSGAGTGSTSNGAGTGAAGATATSGAASTDVSGTLQALTGNRITVKTSDGHAVTVGLTGATSFYLAQSAAPSALKAGQRVTATLLQSSGATQGFSAGTITIGPAGTLYAYVKDSQAAAGGFGFSPSGTVSSVSSGTLNLAMAAGRAFALAMTSSTRVYQLVSGSSDAIPVGTTISVHERSGAGTPVADNVVASSVAGTVASLTEAPARRAGGAGGSGAGAGQTGGN